MSLENEEKIININEEEKTIFEVKNPVDKQETNDVGELDEIITISEIDE